MSDHLTLEPRAGDLAIIVSESVQHARLRDRSCAIELTGPERVDGVWDPDRLGHVVDNLLGNAIRYGDGAIAVTLAEDGRQVILAVHNGGPPIPVSVQPTLFDPFRRAGRARGVGLGLYLVDQIVRAHRGTIEVTSTAHSGTTVRVRLPRSLEQ